jgi:alkanesulfonate monooxygenase SsuD/methylene tetrahydromethanopterin reductase-like flavin-dependent oxidoreductase (luciferase family)
MTSLVGPKDRVRERLELYREAGVGTLITTPIAMDPDERVRMMRDIGEMV